MSISIGKRIRPGFVAITPSIVARDLAVTRRIDDIGDEARGLDDRRRDAVLWSE